MQLFYLEVVLKSSIKGITQALINKYVVELPFLWYFEGMKKGGKRHFHAGQIHANDPWHTASALNQSFNSY